MYNKDLLYSTWNSADCGNLNGRGVWERMDTCICMAKSLSCSPEIITTLLISSAAAAAMSLQSCPTLCDPIDSNPSGSPVPGVLQARTLEWVAIFLLQVKVKSESEVAQLCPTLGDPMGCSLPGSSVHEIFQARVLECPVQNKKFKKKEKKRKEKHLPVWRRVYGRMDPCLCVAESPCCAPETITTLVIDHTLI